MKGIMRKRLIALLSAVGLAGPATSAAAQVLKGSNPTPDTRKESQIKLDKAKQENTGGAQTQPQYTRYKKSQADVSGKTVPYADAASKDAARMSKVTHEHAATQDVINEKRQKTAVHPDALTVKQKASTSPAGKRVSGGGAGKVAHDAYLKTQKSTAEAGAAQKDANIKMQKAAQPKQ